MNAKITVQLGCIAFLMTAAMASSAHSGPRPSIKTEPATCSLWNESSARSQMRLTLALWVRAYLEQQRGVSFPRGYADRDVRRFLDLHCSNHVTDDIQEAADALGQSFISRSTEKVG
jgi:hypothetical protein